LASEVSRGFDAAQYVAGMTGPLPADARLALGQIESMTYLRNQLLRDSDWASMDHSVELRTPLVDAHLLSSLQPLLASFSMYPGKQLLAASPQPPLPEQVTARRKTGFGIPVGRWLAAASPGNQPLHSRAWAVRLVDAYRQQVGDEALSDVGRR